MKEQLVSLETAKLAEEKGYKLDKWFNYIELAVNLPTQSLLQKWIREVHNIDIIIASNLIGYGYLLYKRYPPKNITNGNVYQKYEEALEEGLSEALKLIT